MQLHYGSAGLAAAAASYERKNCGKITTAEIEITHWFFTSFSYFPQSAVPVGLS